MTTLEISLLGTLMANVLGSIGYCVWHAQRLERIYVQE